MGLGSGTPFGHPSLILMAGRCPKVTFHFSFRRPELANPGCCSCTMSMLMLLMCELYDMMLCDAV